MEYTTSDLYIASFLLAKGIKFKKVTTFNPRRKGFVFEDEQLIAELVAGYFKGTIGVAPAKLFAAFKQLKHELYG